MDFGFEYILENERVKLEPLHEDHLELLFLAASQKEIWTFFDEEGTDIVAFKNYIFSALKSRSKKEQYPYVMYDKKRMQYVGMTRLYAYDSILKNIKLGHTWLGKEFQGTGLNKASKHCILKFAFEKLLVERVGFGVHEQNIKSIRAMKSLGATQEGLLRNYLNRIDEPGRCNLLLFSITKLDWSESINLDLKNQYHQFIN